MDSELTRRGLIAAIVGGGAAAGAMSPVSGYLRRFAPLSGRAWADATDRTNDTVRSPYGPASVAYDDEYGVPTIEADDERALYFATGYVHGANRLFQLDLQRRQMRGQLSEVVGEATLSSDEFHRRMDFARAADATWDELADSETADLVEAYADGVNACIENEPLPVEFGLLDYEPAAWTPQDTVLMEKQIAWQLTGSFETLRNAAAADALGTETASDLYPYRLDHDAPILRDTDGGRPDAVRENSMRTPSGDARGLARWLSGFESPPGIGSNSWVVSGDLTESGRPLVANDPHLSLMAPPVWFEQVLDAPDYSVRGVTFPGVPFVVIGENDHGAWGFTNVGADVMDFYSYETRPGEYRYRGEWEAFETEEVTIPVADAPDETITRRTTRHGPYLEREGYSVAVAWTGLTATRTTDAIYDFNRSTGLSDVLAATELFDEPTQNLVYADADGNTLYYATGQIPVRTIDGEEVRGDQLFDGSAGEGEWAGFTPYGTTDWSQGFVPFDEKPGVVNPAYVGTANQRVTDSPKHYLAESYSDPYRGIRIYERLDERVQSDDPVTFEFAQDLHDDAYDGRSALADPLADAIEGDYPGYASALRDWDGEMVRGSTAALAFALWFDEYKRELFDPRFEGVGLDDAYYPRDWVVQHFDPDGEWFAERSRAAVMRAAFDAAVETIDAEGYETYGDYNTTEAITHPFGQSFLNYPSYPTDGSRATVNNYAVERPTGSSWRMVCEPGGRSVGVIPGGNDGEVWSDHYSDQLEMWADTEYKPLPVTPGETSIRFVEGER